MSEKPTDANDIQAILATLQEEIRQHRLALGELGAIERPDPLAKVRQHAWVSSHLPIGWPVMPKGIVAKMIAYSKKIVRRLLRWYINPIVDQQNTYNADVSEALAQAFASLAEQARHLGELDHALAALRDDSSKYTHDQEVTRLRLQRLENWRHGEQPAPTCASDRSASAASGAEESAADVDYFLLGAQYRSEAELVARIHDYDDLFSPLQRRQSQGLEPVRPVLDIGCGRGQLVAHLAAMGLQAYGVDIDADALSMGRAEGRRVEYADALSHLESLADDSLAAVTLIQVIEHLPIPDQLTLYKTAARKLAPGGFIIVETINPSCLAALANAYLLDPSHRAPMHPQMTRFLMEQAGLWRVQIRLLRPVEEAGRLRQLPTLPGAGHEALNILNQDIIQLNEILFGAQDYAAIAYKPEEQEA